jgi:hypothetical protein
LSADALVAADPTLGCRGVFQAEEFNGPFEEVTGWASDHGAFKRPVG